MTETKKNIPALRFPEFEGEWEENEIIDITDYVDYRGKSPTKTDSGVFLVTAKNVKKGYIDYEISKEYILASEFDEVMRRGKPKIGDVLITTEAPLGNVAQVDRENIALAQRVIKYRGKKDIASNDFIKQLFLSDSFQKSIDNKGTGTTAKGIKGSVLHKIKVVHPSFPEQQKIADFLSSVDERIEKLNEKKTTLETYKKGIMQQLFSQEIRFKDENGNDYPDWQEKKMGKYILSYKLGGNYGNSETITEFPLIKMGNLDRGRIKLDKLEYIKIGETVNNEDQLKIGDLLFNTRNTLDLVGKVAIWRNELSHAHYNSNIMRFKFENNYFMNYMLNSFNLIKKLRRIATGTTSVAAIYTDDLLKITIRIPTLAEQQKIADFLSSIDELIDKSNNQIAEAQAYKKGLLQQMFV